MMAIFTLVSFVAVGKPILLFFTRMVKLRLWTVVLSIGCQFDVVKQVFFHKILKVFLRFKSLYIV